MRSILKLINWPVPRQTLKRRHKTLLSLGHQPILIYTMGKVGSSTVFQSIRRSGVSSLVYHVHFLTAANLERTKKRYEDAGHTKGIRLSIAELLTGHVGHMPASYAVAELCQADGQWNVVSLVRDPIATFFSHVFQNPQIHRPFLLGQDGKLDREKVENHIRQKFTDFDPARDFIAGWFNTEFLPFTGIDVYSYPFDQSQGHCVIREAKWGVALVTLESLETSLSAALSDLLGKECRVQISNTNLRSETADGELYAEIKNSITIPADCLERIYSTRYARHFYSSEQRSRWIDKWSRPRDSNSTSSQHSVGRTAE